MKYQNVPVAVWLSDSYAAQAAHIVIDSKRLANCCSITSTSLDMSEYGWLRIGSAQIIFDVSDPAELVENQVELLRRQIQTTRAEAQHKVEQLEEQIQKLLALPNLTEEV